MKKKLRDRVLRNIKAALDDIQLIDENLADNNERDDNRLGTLQILTTAIEQMVMARDRLKDDIAERPPTPKGYDAQMDADGKEQGKNWNHND